MDVALRLEALEAENARLREKIAQLQDLLVADFRAPVEWRLTPSEEMLIGALLARESCTKDQIYTTMFGARIDDGPEPKIIDVFVCKVRKKLRPFGVTINTLWGRGYALDPDDRTRLRNGMARERIAA